MLKINKSRMSKCYISTSRKVISNFFYFPSFFLIYFYAMEKRGIEGLSENAQRKKRKRKLHISNYARSFITLEKRLQPFFQQYVF